MNPKETLKKPWKKPYDPYESDWKYLVGVAHVLRETIVL